MHKVLITESVAQAGTDLLSQAHEVTLRVRPSKEELLQTIGDYDGLIVRSSTQVTAEVLAKAQRLKVVGRAGTGVDNIDVDAATRRGIVVVNAPTSNTIAVAEHTLALMLSLARHIAQANTSTHCGKWDKKALIGTELRGKTLGLIGLGRVGTAVARRVEAFEMRVIAYDPFVSPERAARLKVELVGVDELLSQADYASLHTPSTERTRGMIGARQLALMKPSAYLINCARGDLIDQDALVEALQGSQIAGAALDVFPNEPDVDENLCGCSNLLLTPHLGASTEEAQSDAAVQVVRQMIDVLSGRLPRFPVNATAMSAEEMSAVRPYADLAQRLGRFYAQYAENNLRHVELKYAGDVAERDTSVITTSALAGLLSEAGQEPVNVVNARIVAEDRGLEVSETRTSRAEGFTGVVSLCVETTTGDHVLNGTIIRGEPHIIGIDNYSVDFVPTGSLLLDQHFDQPGVIGKIGTLLGDAQINISFVQVGREAKGGYALMVLGLDERIPSEVLAQISSIPSIRSARAINLTGLE